MENERVRTDERSRLQEADTLLLSAVRSFLGTESREELAQRAAQVQDWEHVIARAQAHGVLGIVADVLATVDSRTVPAAVLERLSAEVRRAQIACLRYQAEVSKVVAALATRGVEPIVLKGLATSRLYRDPCLRPSSDLDLLVDESDFASFRQAMDDLGAVAVGEDLHTLPARLTQQDSLDHWLAFKTSGGLRVECTFDPLQLGLKCRERAGFRDTAVPLPGLANALMLAPEYELVMLSIHLNRHGFRRLIWFVDIGLLLQSNPSLNWETVERLARSENISGPVRHTIDHVSSELRLGLPSPAWRMRSGRLATYLWQRYWPAEELVRFSGLHEGPLVFRQRESGRSVREAMSMTPANLALTGRVWDKARYLGRKLVPPKPYLEERAQGNSGSRSYASLWLRRARAALSTRQGHDSELSGKFARGVAWNTVAKVSTRGMQFFVTVALARLLVPRDFGLSQVAATVTMFAVMFAEFGFGYALVQKAEISEDDTATATLITLLLAAALSVAGFVSAPVIAALFHARSAAGPIAVACIGVFVAALGITPRAMLTRSFDFRSIAIADFSSSVVYGAAAIVLALLGMGVWSLVLAGVAMSFTQATVTWARSDCRFRLRMNQESARALTPFGARMFGISIVEYLRMNLDYIVVGRVLGPASLGLYSVAFRIADFPRSRLASIVSDVAFPAMSSVQKEPALLRQTYLRALEMGSLIAFPLLTGFTAVAREFVYVVYGKAWLAAVGPLRILLPMGLLLIVCQQSGFALAAKGEPEWQFRLTILYALSVGILASYGARFGLAGVAFGVLAATVVFFIASQLVLWRRTQVSPLATVRGIAVPALGSAAMIAAILGYKSAVSFPQASWGAAVAWLAGAGALGAVVYGVAVLLTRALRSTARAETGDENWHAEGERFVEQPG